MIPVSLITFIKAVILSEAQRSRRIFYVTLDITGAGSDVKWHQRSKDCVATRLKIPDGFSERRI